MNESPKYVVIPWELAVSLDETLDMDLRMASIYDGDDIDGSGIAYGDEAEGILEDRKALRKAMAKAIEDGVTPDLFNQNAIVWHKYPDDPPPLSGFYLVTVVFDTSRYVTSATYKEEEERFWLGKEINVIAWAYTPEPFEEDENE